MPLSDEYPSVVDALGQPKFEYLGLQPSLQEVLQLETEHVIELHAGLVQHSDTHQPSQEGVAFKQSPERERERERGREIKLLVLPASLLGQETNTNPCDSPKGSQILLVL